MKRLLVPTDFSKGAEQALARALLLPRSDGATVHVVHVVPQNALARAKSAARLELEALVARARGTVRGSAITLTSALLSGEPFVEIIRASRELEASLIVLGRHGRRPLRDMVIGTTAARVIRKGDTPVLAVNTRPAQPYRRPLIATDLEDSAPRVVGLTLDVLEPAVKVIHVVHAFNVPFEGFVTPTMGGREKSEYRRSFHDTANVGMTKLLARFARAGVRFEPTIRAADPRALIVNEVLRRRADLVSLGTHGRSGLSHALVGSVAEWVIAEVPCDVLVARPVRFSFELP